MSKTGFTLNTKDFGLKFDKITGKTILKNAAFGMMRVAAIVLADAIKEEPRAPHLTGNLWREQLILPPQIKHDEISIEFGFNTHYAARLHETMASLNWTLTGSGPKYLEAKLMRNKEKYMKAEAEFIKRGI